MGAIPDYSDHAQIRFREAFVMRDELILLGFWLVTLYGGLAVRGVY